jgi:tetratricopeptide (TPR) repeat protein
VIPNRYNRSAVPHRAALLLVLLGSGTARPQAATPSRPSSASFDDLARRAEAARVEGRLEEAAALYRKALAARPRWADGLWALGTIAYEQDRFAECRDVFARLTGVQPKMAPAWALRGMCEFRLGAYARARTHLGKAVGLGIRPDDDLGRAALYHHALLLTQQGAFELAIAPLKMVAYQQTSPDLDVACGLVLLRKKLLPASIPEAELDFVRRAGHAYCANLGRHPDQAAPLYDALIQRHPRERYLHYGRGLALAQQGKDEALLDFRKEIELYPDDAVEARLCFGLLARGRDAEAVAPAEEAVRLAPGVFVTHLVLGRALAGTGGVERGIRELQTAAALDPRIPEIHLALARAYAQAGRKREAEAAMKTFRSLEEERRGATLAGQPAVVGP